MPKILRHFIAAIILVEFVFSAFRLEAQSTDTLRMMAYNLLHYRNFTTYCTLSNNNPTAKEGHLRTLFGYYLPHVLVVNEMGASPVTVADSLLRHVFDQVSTPGRYQRAAYSNNGSSIINMLFFDSEKVALYRQDAIGRDLQDNNIVRVLDIYTLFVKDPALPQHRDTLFFTVAAAHLKAGSGSSDQAQRARATEALMAYLEQHELKGNVFFAGDLNLYGSSEAAFQHLTAHPTTEYRFYDPVNAIGAWSDNQSFAQHHTQSTRTSFTNGGCFASSGLDDRFDWILAHAPVLDPANRLHYVAGSYRAMGNNGNNFNQALYTFGNGSVPNAVAEALYMASDHIPVVMSLAARLGPVGISQPHSPGLTVYHGPDGWYAITSTEIAHGNVVLELFDLQGRRLWLQTVGTDRQSTFIPQPAMAGIFLLRASDAAGGVRVVKVFSVGRE